MSGIAAIYNLDGEPVDRGGAGRMLDAIAHRGPDQRAVWHGGAVALGHVGLSATPEAVSETQPLLSSDGLVCITVDGRVDNRDELQRALDQARVVPRADSDAALMLGAYEHWGEEFPSHVLGDFAVVIWDGRKRRLVCARDIVGLRPFYYGRHGNRFVCGSELQQIFAAGVPVPEPNEGMVGEYLIDQITSLGDTLYKNIFRLPAARVMVVQPDGVRQRRYYDPVRGNAIRYKTDSQYADHFTDVFSQAVRCRLRSNVPVVAAYLSGGLDSSSIVGHVEQLRRSGAIAPFQFETFSIAAPDMPDDESPYIDDVTRRWSLNGHVRRPRIADRDAFVAQVRRYMDTPDFPNVIAARDLAVTVRDRGARVVLGGFGGDDWLCTTTHLAELLSEGRLIEFCRRSCSEVGSSGWRAAADTVVRRGFWPLMPGRVRRAVRRARGAPPMPAEIVPEYAKRCGLAERIVPPRIERGKGPRGRQELYHWLSSGSFAFGNENDDRYHAWFGLEPRHPFCDRRFIEFALAIPERQRQRGSQTKFILRRAMTDVLPPSVRARLTKGDSSYTFMWTIAALGGERCFASLETARRGWVHQDRILSLYRETARQFSAGDERYSRNVRRLGLLFGIELWLKEALT